MLLCQSVIYQNNDNHPDWGGHLKQWPWGLICTKVLYSRMFFIWEEVDLNAKLLKLSSAANLKWRQTDNTNFESLKLSIQRRKTIR
jgi:hypothetical protein